MYPPIQSEPVQRSTVGQPSPYGGGANGDAAVPQGVVASEYGVEPSFGLGDLVKLGRQVLGI